MDEKLITHTCLYNGCTNSRRTSPQCSFFKFPIKDEKRCRQWLTNCGNLDLLKNTNLSQKVICEKHFSKESFKNYFAKNKRLNYDVVPLKYEEAGDNVMFIHPAATMVEYDLSPKIKKEEYFETDIFAEDEIKIEFCHNLEGYKTDVDAQIDNNAEIDKWSSNTHFISCSKNEDVEIKSEVENCNGMSQRKRKAFSIEEKARIIRRLESGENNSVIGKECGISSSTISTMWRDREKIKTLFEQNSLNLKRLRPSAHKAVEDALLKWIKFERNLNDPINGPILQQKAVDIAKRMGNLDFQCSPSWVQRFRVRHNIALERISDKHHEIMESLPTEWFSNSWQALSDGYSEENIFNADETSLFFGITPDKIIQFEEERCLDGEIPDERVTILVTTNMTGLCKEKLLVIGTQKRQVHSGLPVDYQHNAKAWITLELFEKWLCKWDEELKLQGRKILLFLNDHPVHRTVHNFKCIKLVFLPPYILQPLRQGVIRSFKTHYRKLQICRTLKKIQETESTDMNMSDAIVLMSEAWDKVTKSAIAKCFCLAGFNKLSSTFLDQTTDEEDTSLALLLQQLAGCPLSTNDIENFVSVDKNVAICGEITKERSLDVTCKNEEEETKGQYPPPTLSESLEALTVLQTFLRANKEFSSELGERFLKDLQCKMERVYEMQETKVKEEVN